MKQLIIEHLAFTWPDGKGLLDIDLQLAKGDFAIIRGPSGMGKSTLLRLLVRLEEPQKGRILLEGEDISGMLPNFLRQKIALVMQTPQLEHTSLDEVLRFPFHFAINAQREKPSKEAIQEYMKLVCLENLPLDVDASTLSLGQQQRVALVRHILLKPAVLLLDEPTSALDAESRIAVEQSIENLNALGTTILMITHTEYTPKRPHQVWYLEQGCLRKNQQGGD